MRLAEIAPAQRGEAHEYLHGSRRCVVLQKPVRTRGRHGFQTYVSVRYLDDGAPSIFGGRALHKIVASDCVPAARFRKEATPTGRVLFMASSDGYLETDERVAERAALAASQPKGGT